jgi:nucleotide-binding universal stress UspA family protein
MPRPILHASDFSPASRRAFRTAVDIARAQRAPLLVAHVLPPLPLVPDVYVAAQTYDALVRSQRQAAQKQLDRLVADARRRGARASGLLLDFGPAAPRIVAAARAKRAQLLVIGTHGRTGLGRALIGSVATRVLAMAPCPVLTVRGRRGSRAG